VNVPLCSKNGKSEFMDLFQTMGHQIGKFRERAGPEMVGALLFGPKELRVLIEQDTELRKQQVPAPKYCRSAKNNVVSVRNIHGFGDRHS
jgi:hypothetical protein